MSKLEESRNDKIQRLLHELDEIVEDISTSAKNRPSLKERAASIEMDEDDVEEELKLSANTIKRILISLR